MLRLINSVGAFVRLWWLTGPIFEKELRVSSRRKRNYILRSVYLLLLTLFVGYIWGIRISMRGTVSASFQASQMSAVARTVVTTIAWFQFISLQLIAVVMLSNSINLEVRRRTLDVLVSTPITSLQIVMGKLFSKLLQLLLLLAMSLPMLAVVRLMGGVPWDYVVAALCVTFSAAIFAGSVSLFLSTTRPQAYSVIAGGVGVGVLLYGGLPAIMSLCHFLTDNSFFTDTALPVVLAINPFAIMGWLTSSMLAAGGGGGGFVWWPVHCGLMLAFSVLVLAVAVVRVRPALANRGKRSFAYRLGRRFGKGNSRIVNVVSTAPQAAPMTLRITGDPIIWREVARPLKGALFSEKIQHIVFAAVLIVVYGIACYYEVIGERGFHAGFVGVMGLVILMRTASFAATAIASEKQSKAWPILLTTPLDNWHIVRSKAIAVGRKTMFLWIVLLVHVAIFVVFGVLHPLSLVGAVYSLVPAAIFLIGSGLFCGTLFKTTTGAIVGTFAAPILGWFFCPCFSFGNPIFYAGMSMMIEVGTIKEMFTGNGTLEAWFILMMAVLPSIAYTVVGVFLIWLAKSRVRFKIFG